jgi:hypothetical protein
MSNRQCLPVCALALVAAAFSACSSTSSEGSMSPQDKSVWMNAREQHGVGMLDDKTYQVTMVAAGHGSDTDTDTLEFAGGRFHSTACDPYGFGSGTYTTTKVDGGWDFHATCVNGSGGTNAWHGSVRGDTIEGGFVCTQPGSPTMEGSFRGSKVH